LAFLINTSFSLWLPAGSLPAVIITLPSVCLKLEVLKTIFYTLSLPHLSYISAHRKSLLMAWWNYAGLPETT
jgi:hypothetical protein